VFDKNPRKLTLTWSTKSDSVCAILRRISDCATLQFNSDVVYTKNILNSPRYGPQYSSTSTPVQSLDSAQISKTRPSWRSQSSRRRNRQHLLVTSQFSISVAGQRTGQATWSSYTKFRICHHRIWSLWLQTTLVSTANPNETRFHNCPSRDANMRKYR
jgi:hypothetical protein